MAKRAQRDKAGSFYAEAIGQLNRSKIPFLIAGTFAVNVHTGLDRSTADLDLFCKASDSPKILAHFRELGYKVEVTDERWLAKVRSGRYHFDVIFNSSMAITPITEAWFQDAQPATLYGQAVTILAPTELVWSKLFMQSRHRYDGADVAHVILQRSERIDWNRLLDYAGQYWEVLLVHVLNFRFIYPTERERIPPWVLDELLERLKIQASMPAAKEKVCRGRLFSPEDYLKDVTEWGFADIIGPPGEKS